jgi:hypothetical protein
VQSRQARPNPAWRLCLRPIRDDFMIEFLEAERRVAECNARIERQRQVIEELRSEGRDITSAKAVFDSLYLSLSIHVRDRHQLRARLNTKAA